MEHVIWGMYGKSNFDGLDVFRGKVYKFKFVCTYSLENITVKSDKDYTVDSMYNIPVGFGLHNLKIYAPANFIS